MDRCYYITNKPKYGSANAQRELIGEAEKELDWDEIDLILNRDVMRKGDVLSISHAGVIGLYDDREKLLDKLQKIGCLISVAGGEPVAYDTLDKQAEFHAMAKIPTGKGTRKQKRNKGRPPKYKKPNDEQKAKLLIWWNGAMHTDDVEALAGEMLNRKVPRATLAEWLGKRGSHPDRRRKSSVKNKK